MESAGARLPRRDAATRGQIEANSLPLLAIREFPLPVKLPSLGDRFEDSRSLLELDDD